MRYEELVRVSIEILVNHNYVIQNEQCSKEINKKLLNIKEDIILR